MKYLASFFLTILIVGCVAFDEWGVRWLVAPWSYQALGPTLTGIWAGPLRARQGADYFLLVELAYTRGSRRRPWDTNLGGRATVCTRHGALYDYAVSGDADRDGRNLAMLFTYGDPAQSALDLRLDGDWKAPVLEVTPRNNPFLPDGRFELRRSISSADPDDSFGTAELRRTDRASFLAACGRLAQ